jgi:hypothetical protein
MKTGRQQGITTMNFPKVSMMLAPILSLVLFSSVAIAQEKNSKSSSKKTTVNFEDQLVEGQTQKPELFYLLQQRNNNFKRLIRLRENFLPEMRKTSEDVGRSGKGN